jgi:hypothetical protein
MRFIIQNNFYTKSHQLQTIFRSNRADIETVRTNIFANCHHSSGHKHGHLPPAEDLCGNLSDIHPVCALGRRQTNAMTSRCTFRSAPLRFRWITFEFNELLVRSQAAASLPLFDNSSLLLSFEVRTNAPHRSRTLSGEFALSYQTTPPAWFSLILIRHQPLISLSNP